MIFNYESMSEYYKKGQVIYTPRGNKYSDLPPGEIKSPLFSSKNYFLFPYRTVTYCDNVRHYNILNGSP